MREMRNCIYGIASLAYQTLSVISPHDAVDDYEMKSGLNSETFVCMVLRIGTISIIHLDLTISASRDLYLSFKSSNMVNLPGR